MPLGWPESLIQFSKGRFKYLYYKCDVSNSRITSSIKSGAALMDAIVNRKLRFAVIQCFEEQEVREAKSLTALPIYSLIDAKASNYHTD